MICQMRPRMRCSRPSERSDDPMLTTEQPIPFAEVMTMLLFSVIWNAFSGFRGCGLLRTRVSMVSGTESLISLERIKPSLHSSKSCIVSVGIGYRFATSGSFSMTSKGCQYNRRSQTHKAHKIDVISEFGSFIFVNRMADVSVGTLHSDLSGLCADPSLLLTQFDIKLRANQTGLDYPQYYCAPQPSRPVQPFHWHQR